MSTRIHVTKVSIRVTSIIKCAHHKDETSKVNGICNVVDEQNNSFIVYWDDAFKSKAYYLHDMPINQDASEWNSYRLSLSRMKSIRDVSTHWRATCNFQTDGVKKRDYIRTSFAKNDLFAVPGQDRCDWYELFNN